MTLSPDVLTLAAPDVPAAQSFYTATFGLAHQIALHETDATSAGFRGFVVSYIVHQPSEVSALLAAAVRNGATVLKPAKKMMFAGFSASFRAPDGAVWKIATENRKDTGPAAEPPVPVETVVILGVADPKASKVFYETLGMTADHDYGAKFIDFRPASGTHRLGLMRRPTLAKDVNVDPDGSGSRGMVLNRNAESRDEVDTLVAAAAAAGGTVLAAPAETDSAGYSGGFTDLDGHHWTVSVEP